MALLDTIVDLDLHGEGLVVNVARPHFQPRAPRHLYARENPQPLKRTINDRGVEARASIGATQNNGHDQAFTANGLALFAGAPRQERIDLRGGSSRDMLWRGPAQP